jgi:uncharacterized membrane protein YphA (DoxX/SURF4 family)
MIFPQLIGFTDVALLLLRIMVGIVVITSGWKHLSNPAERGKDIEMRAEGTFRNASGIGLAEQRRALQRPVRLFDYQVKN